MQAIETKYLGPTNYRGARIRASAEVGSITISWDYALNVEANHDAAARAFIAKWARLADPLNLENDPWARCQWHSRSVSSVVSGPAQAFCFACLANAPTTAP